MSGTWQSYVLTRDPNDAIGLCTGKTLKIPGHVRWTNIGLKPPWLRPQAVMVDAHVGTGLSKGQGPISVLVPNTASKKPFDLVQDTPADTCRIKQLCKEGRLGMAVDVLSSMDPKDGVPSVDTYFQVLDLCMRRKALVEAKQVHAHLAKNGLECHRFLNETLVNTLIKCGNLADALGVFNKMSKRSAFSWTAIIAGYCSSGQAKEALRMYKQMRREGVQPDTFTFVGLLKACGALANLEEGKRIHAEIVQCGCELDLFVGNTLINMYGKCGSMVEAEDVFKKLPVHNVVSWNVLIAGYAQNRQPERAVELYGQMQNEGLRPDGWTFSIVLKACTKLAETEERAGGHGELDERKWLQEGKKIYDEAVLRGYGLNVVLASSVVHMYAECGRLEEAQDVFDTLSERDEVCWNALLGAYVEHEEGNKALQMYVQMRKEGVKPNYLTFVSMLQACANLAETEESSLVGHQPLRAEYLSRAKTYLAEAARTGCGSDLYVNNTAIHAYLKCGSVLDAQYVFNVLQDRDVVSWNAIILGCAQQQQSDKALEIYAEMRSSWVRPDDRTFVSVLKACANLAESEEDTYLNGAPMKQKSLVKVMTTHAEAHTLGYASDVFVGNSLINVYAKCGSMVDALKVFDSMPDSNVVAWNAMIAGYALQQKGEKALQLYTQMQEEGIRPNVWTFATVLTAGADMAESESSNLQEMEPCSSKWLQVAKAIHAEASAHGCARDVFFGSSLVSMYSKCGSLVDAQNVFDKLPKNDVVSWNAIIGGYAADEQGDKALQLFGEMQATGVAPDEISYLWALKACSVTGALDACTEIQLDIADRGYERTLSLTTALIHAFGRCGSMEAAQKVFNALPEADVGAWTALIAGYARLGAYEESLGCFRKMQKAGIRADRLTFLAVLSACSHGGLVDEGILFFDTMTREYGISALSEHYVCMVDLLGRAGLFNEAENLILNMPMPPVWGVWSSLLNACRKHSNIELGRRAFESLLRLDAKRASPYVVMSQIYSDAEMWDSVIEISELKLRAGAWKQPGQSWIEHEHKVHMFMVGDHKLERHEQVNLKLEELRYQRNLKNQTGASSANVSVSPAVDADRSKSMKQVEEV